MFKRERDARRSAIRRCTDRNQASFQQYGARGITVCPAWMESFEQFLLDMGPAPSPKHWLGRLDVTQGYSPANCCWTTRAEQALRRQGVRKVLWQGKPTPAALVEKLPGQPSRRAILARDACGLNMENPPAGSLSAKVIWLSHGGETLPLATWSKRLGIDRTTLLARVKRGLPTEQVLHSGRLPCRKPLSTPAPDR